MIDKSFKGVFHAWQDLCKEQTSCYNCPLRFHCIPRIPTDFEDSDLDYIMYFLYDHGYLGEGR